MRDRMVSYLPVGVVGLGLMGSSIVVSLLAAGHQVVALAPVVGEKEKATKYIVELLLHAEEAGLLCRGLEHCVQALRVTEMYEELSTCVLIQECVVENVEIKKDVYKKITDHVSDEVIIASNTSAIPISQLQGFVFKPERFVGIHWAEPAYMTRFLEVTCGEFTDLKIAERVMELGVGWGKEPTLLKKDVRGFITNRLMYAVYREAISLVEQGHCSLEDADKVFRYDVGSWITLMGIFRRLDFMGYRDYLSSFERLLKRLSRRSDVPILMQQMVDKQARGVHNCKGLYTYTEQQSVGWQKDFALFNKDIYDLAAKYGEQQLIELIKIYDEKQKLSKV